MILITAVDISSDRFTNSFKRLSDNIKEEAISALKDLLQTPPPARLRFNKLSGYSRPNIYAIHITRNHSHKATFEMVGTVAHMRNIGTHKEIDRAP